LFRTKYKLEEAKEIVLDNVLKRKNSISNIHTSNKQVDKNKNDRPEKNILPNNHGSLTNVNKSTCLDEKVNLRSPTNKILSNKFQAQNHYSNEVIHQHGHGRQNSYRKNLTINPVSQSSVIAPQKLASKTPVARGRSDSISKPRQVSNTSVSRISKGNSPVKSNVQNLPLTPNQPTKQIDNNLSEIRKHLSNYYDTKKLATTKNTYNDHYKSYMTSHEDKVEKNQEKAPNTNTNISTNFNEKSKYYGYKQSVEESESHTYPEIEMKKSEEENLQSFINSRKSPYEFSFKKGNLNTFGTINSVDSSRQSNQKSYSRTYNFKPDIMQKNNNINSTNLNDPFFSSKIEEIRNANNKRLQDLNMVNSYINCLSSEFNSQPQSQNTSHSTSKPNEKQVDELTPEDKAYLDSQIEQEKIRFEINKKIKNQVYDNEYSRVNNDIDYVNERLKLNEMSKSYLLNKINEFTTVKSVEEDKKVISQKEYTHYKCKNVEEIENQKNIGK
jgi:hypothetical protein